MLCFQAAYSWEQAGFRRGKSGIDHMFTLYHILEQRAEWNNTIYIAFSDFEKALDSLHRESFRRVLRHYGIPQVACNIHLTGFLSIKSGVKQGCIFLTFLFILVINWPMKEITKDGNTCIRWTVTSILEDLDYADDIGLLSSRTKDMHEKIGKLTTTALQIGLRLNNAKIKLTRNNHEAEDPITVINSDA